MWKPIHLSGRKKRYITLGVVLLALVTTISSALVLQDQSGLNIDVVTTSVSDPSNIGHVTQANISIVNRESNTVSPRFNVIHSSSQTRFYWQKKSGPNSLAPGETGTYTVVAPTPSAAPPSNASFLVTVTDGTDQRRKFIGPINKQLRVPDQILNPSLTHWGVPSGSRHKSPYRWSRTISNHGGEETTISESNSGARLSVKNVTREEGPWAMAGLVQKTSFPRFIKVNATPGTLVDGYKRYPPYATGVEISEGNHRIWVVYANVSERKRIERTSGDLHYVIVHVPAELGQRISTKIHVSDIYMSQGWALPEEETYIVDGEKYSAPRVDILTFAAVYPDTERRGANIQIHSISSTQLNRTEPLSTNQ